MTVTVRIELPPDGYLLRYYLATALTYLAWYSESKITIRGDIIKISCLNDNVLKVGLEMLIYDVIDRTYGIEPPILVAGDKQRLLRGELSIKSPKGQYLYSNAIVLRPLMEELRFEKIVECLKRYVDYVKYSVSSYSEELSKCLGVFSKQIIKIKQNKVSYDRKKRQINIKSSYDEIWGYINDVPDPKNLDLIAPLSFMTLEFLEHIRSHGATDRYEIRDMRVGLHSICLSLLGAWLSKFYRDRQTGIAHYVFITPERINYVPLRIIISNHQKATQEIRTLVRERELSTYQLLTYCCLNIPGVEDLIYVTIQEGTGYRNEVLNVMSLDVKPLVLFAELLRLSSRDTLDKLLSIVKSQNVGAYVSSKLIEILQIPDEVQFVQRLYDIYRIIEQYWKDNEKRNFRLLTTYDKQVLMEALQNTRKILTKIGL